MTDAPERLWGDAHFWPHVSIQAENECWLWTGPKMGVGYGSVRPQDRATMTGAHRVSWAMHNQRWPMPGEVVMHKCDTPACVNPQHLQVGSQSDNIQDCVKKGRHKPFIPTPKTHCHAGHEYTEANTEFVLSRGKPTRRCIECKRTSNRKWREKHAGR